MTHSHNMSNSVVKEIAERSLKQNIINLNSGPYLAAGAHQFKSFWTRDFCFAVRGLLAANRADVVKNQLTFLIQRRRKDDLVPLYVDSIAPVLRVVTSIILQRLGLDYSLKMNDEIHPYFLVNNKFEAIDSNLMVLYASRRYAEATGDHEWFDQFKPDLRKIFDFYNSKKSKLLISQGEHADWQDSAQRKGEMFFTNLLYYQAARDYGFLPADEVEALKLRIVEVFFDAKAELFKSMAERENISLEGNLWAIEHDLIIDRELLYAGLRRHPLFTENGGIPGFATYPSYRRHDTYIQVKLVGLQEYHGNLYWSWLVAYSAKIALMMNDTNTFERVYAVLERMLTRDRVVAEIYDHNATLTPFRSFLYKSEAPFSWGAAFVLDLHSLIERRSMCS